MQQLTLNEVDNIKSAHYVVFDRPIHEVPMEITYGKVYELFSYPETEMYSEEFYVVNEAGIQSITPMLLCPQKYYI
ncbi:hypothetical protein G7L40_00435 [Paenibacillus polymyxa]|uniref:Uncharacterized protein n=1 Tax=Paenibacillus polymyxa TaxID=1406 RepID=A0A378XV67_PAEPO|nr:hypothetical protein [Paenibacillus polymyxa]MBE7897177.1 hypothetical protein [Paenibacillus polymyxa]MBG9763034.1 hypothetical protein [Paenibacillus polymyxa]MCC3257574.1 hypothetical protein [Paenibacillus polymyxa]QPK51343.1 hypothetical protein G7035_00435 [Paenibacillus polymyxa]QPK56433.1 hypothetical protein G7L40_00435 [Paenibacillus polymyxa]